jgi:hypothetical protein
VDLGAIYHIDEVVLNWEAEYAKQYFLQLSDSASGWTNIWQETNGDGGIDSIRVSANSRFLRLLGIQRATPRGYSLYEIEVYGSTTTGVVSPERTSGGPVSYYLYESFPNPFNPSTTIEFTLPRSNFVTLKVFNILGEEVATLAGQDFTAGSYRVDWNAKGVASGVYLYRLVAGSFVETKKMLLLR